MISVEGLNGFGRAGHSLKLTNSAAAAGSSMDRVVRATVYLVSMDDFAAVNAVYATHFPGEPPARACVEVRRLPKDARVEIDAIAVLAGA